MRISDRDREDLLELAASASLRDDMRRIASSRRVPTGKTGDMDYLIAFLTELNEFLGHEPKPFRPMLHKDMKL